MEDMIMDMATRLLVNNWQIIAVAALILGGAGFAIGLAKKLAGSLLNNTLSGGEAVANQLAKKPKAVGLALGVFGLCVAAGWAYHRFKADKVVIKEVQVAVTDNSMIEHLRKQLDEVQVAKATAAAKADALQNELSNQKAAAEAAQEAKRLAESEAAAVAKKLEDMSPKGDAVKLRKLKDSYDELHATQVFDDAMSGPGNGRLNLSKFTQHKHEKEALAKFYHRNCNTCAKNFEVRQAMDEVFKRHPGWLLDRWEDGKRDKWEEYLDDQITAFGETKSVKDWAEDDARGTYVTANIIAMRLADGWEPRKAVEIEYQQWRGTEESAYRKELEIKKKAERERRRAIKD